MVVTKFQIGLISVAVLGPILFLTEKRQQEAGVANSFCNVNKTLNLCIIMKC